MGVGLVFVVPFVLALFTSLLDLRRDLAWRRRGGWMPLIEELGGSGHAGHARVTVAGRDVELLALQSLSGPMTSHDHTVARLALPDHPVTIRPRPVGGPRGLQTGDASFDAAYIVLGPPEAVAWFTPEVRRAMARDGDVELHQGQLQVTIDGFEEDLDRVRALLHDAATIATGLAWDPHAHVDKLMVGVADPVLAVRERSLRTLIATYPDRVAEVAPLGDPAPTLRMLAATHLHAPEVLIGVIDDPDCPATTRTEALAHLEAHEASLTDRLTRGLLELAQSEDWETQRVALACLARNGGVDALEPLREIAAQTRFLSTRRGHVRAALSAIVEREGSRRGGLALADAAGGVSVARRRQPVQGE